MNTEHAACRLLILCHEKSVCFVRLSILCTENGKGTSRSELEVGLLLWVG
jgi:hypothetical protein